MCQKVDRGAAESIGQPVNSSIREGFGRIGQSTRNARRSSRHASLTPSAFMSRFR